MLESEVIIIGGGASGLFAARELSRKKKNVVVLEARNRLGGRIYTLTPAGFSIPIEAGAEFIHGELPITISLLKEADIPFYTVEGETYQVKKGRIKESGEIMEGFSVLASRVKKLKKDIPLSEFLKKYLNEGKYRGARESVIRFVEGYDAADINKASTFALSEEWGSEGVSSPFRIEGGYRSVIEFLSKEIVKLGAKILTSAVVKKIDWKKNSAEITTENGDLYKSAKVLITVPAGVLKSSRESRSFINFSPELKGKSDALEEIGYGSVVKVFFEFNQAFWDSAEGNARIRQPGFIISDTIFTAWWSQLPKKIPLLTGWFAGPNVEKMQDLSDQHLNKKAITALSGIFDAEESFIREKIKSGFIANWKTDSFSMGAYSYATIQTPEAKKILNKPVEGTLFFAGEALSEDESMGTVEAAFASGLSASEKILNS